MQVPLLGEPIINRDLQLRSQSQLQFTITGTITIAVFITSNVIVIAIVIVILLEIEIVISIVAVLNVAQCVMHCMFWSVRVFRYVKPCCAMLRHVTR